MHQVWFKISRTISHCVAAVLSSTSVTPAQRGSFSEWVSSVRVVGRASRGVHTVGDRRTDGADKGRVRLRGRSYG